MTEMMEHAQEAAIHDKCVTVKVRDLQFVNKVTGLGPSGPNNRLQGKSVDGNETRTRNKKNQNKKNVDGGGTRGRNNKDKNKTNKDKKTK